MAGPSLAMGSSSRSYHQVGTFVSFTEVATRSGVTFVSFKEVATRPGVTFVSFTEVATSPGVTFVSFTEVATSPGVTFVHLARVAIWPGVTIKESVMVATGPCRDLHGRFEGCDLSGRNPRGTGGGHGGSRSDDPEVGSIRARSRRNLRGRHEGVDGSRSQSPVGPASLLASAHQPQVAWPQRQRRLGRDGPAAPLNTAPRRA
jgi:hypothetical protein